MTNLEVLRAVQHAWSPYCWPFANGNGYSLTASPSSPPYLSKMAELKSPDHLYERPNSRCTSSNRSSPAISPTVTSGITIGVKNERLTPDDIIANHEFQNLQNLIKLNKSTTSYTPSPSASPKSQTSNQARTPSFPCTPPHPAFTPPMSLPPGCFSPAVLGGLTSNAGQAGIPRGGAQSNFMDSGLPRNCSALMRSLAAKYNNNNNSEYINKHHRAPVNLLVTAKPSHLQINTDNKDIQHSNVQADQNNSRNYKASPPPLLPTHLPVLSQQSPNAINPFSSTQALLAMVRNASTNNNKSPLQNINNNNNFEKYEPTSINARVKRSADSSSPLDLSSSVSSKRMKINDDVNSSSNSLETKTESSPPPIKSIDTLLSWSVEDVCAFIRTIDLCSEYANIFSEQRIDGWCLSLLTETHLTSTLNMKLGPALKLRSILSSRIAPSNTQSSCLQCIHNHNNVNQGQLHQSSHVHSSHHLTKKVANHTQNTSSQFSPPSRPSSSHSDSGVRSPSYTNAENKRYISINGSNSPSSREN